MSIQKGSQNWYGRRNCTITRKVDSREDVPTRAEAAWDKRHDTSQLCPLWGHPPGLLLYMDMTQIMIMTLNNFFTMLISATCHSVPVRDTNLCEFHHSGCSHREPRVPSETASVRPRPPLGLKKKLYMFYLVCQHYSFALSRKYLIKPSSSSCLEMESLTEIESQGASHLFL